MEPGSSFFGSPSVWAGFPPPETPCRGSIPSSRSCGAKWSSVAAVNPEKATGVAISSRRMPPLTNLARGGAEARATFASRLHAQHFFNRPDAGDRVLRHGESKRHRAHQTPVDVYRRSAHPLQNSGVGQRPAGEPRQDDRLLRPDVFKHAQDFHLKFLDARTREYSAPDASLACADVL